jgi:gas vesicle protein
MSKKGLGKFVSGAAVGAGLALLFAPKKGSETRKDIKEKSASAINKVKNTDIDEVKNALNKKLNDLKTELDNLDKETAIDIIKEKGNLILKKADELIDAAKEKSMPVIEKSTKEIKNKVSEVLRNTADKIDDNKSNVKATSKKKA